MDRKPVDVNVDVDGLSVRRKERRDDRRIDYLLTVEDQLLPVDDRWIVRYRYCFGRYRFGRSI